MQTLFVQLIYLNIFLNNHYDIKIIQLTMKIYTKRKTTEKANKLNTFNNKIT